MSAQLWSIIQQTWLLVVLAVASIPFGFFADRFSQTRIIARGVVFWSLATIVSGLAPSFSILLVARALVGVGEAAYAPAAQSMISGAFPQERRARAQAIFAAGMLLGGASGLALGGIMGESSGWQHVFFLVGLVGLVPGLSVLKLKEPPRAPRSEVVPIGRLLRVPAFLAMIAAGMFITFSSVSLLARSIDFAVNMMPQRAHATSVGVYMFVTQLVGAFGPQLVGKISDLRDLQVGLQVAVGVMIGGALLMFLVMYFIRRDGLRHPQLAAYHAEAGN